MKDSSEKTISIYTGISFPSVSYLLTLVADSDLRTKDFIKSRFLEQHQHFEETVEFAKAIGLIEDDDGPINILTNFIDLIEQARERGRLQDLLIRQVVRSPGHYSNELKSYLRQFVLSKGRCMKPHDILSGHEYAKVRNLLMEMSVVEFDHDSKNYILDEQYLDIFVLASRTQPVSLVKLKKKLSSCEEIGLLAEKEVIEYEKKIVGPGQSKKIRHVATEDVGAGYDILSFRIKDNKTIPRFIEVKAVSQEFNEFYWTINEIETAAKLGPHYYLYLLPVIANKKFDLEKIEILEDPYQNIYKKRENWSIEENVIRCRKTI